MTLCCPKIIEKLLTSPQAHIALVNSTERMGDLLVNLYASIGTTWFVAVTAVVLRIIARRMLRIHWWVDDYFCLLALVRFADPSTRIVHVY